MLDRQSTKFSDQRRNVLYYERYDFYWPLYHSLTSDVFDQMVYLQLVPHLNSNEPPPSINHSLTLRNLSTGVSILSSVNPSRDAIGNACSNMMIRIQN